ncbi:putative Homeobox protein cut [Danaus plexippus plexippus]|uniref:Homeobox protein cut n=1 Tax=Danaus plexippus plexippus TaxID=278856 RepID=A0A212F2A6_DANPL|nr:putative Homeobox protein cut [Danaus plexippus plexippus]
MHSMDWLFKKERIYLLAQFWQQLIKYISATQERGRGHGSIQYETDEISRTDLNYIQIMNSNNP